LDENGLLRFGGRLQKSNLTFSKKHPILLPSRHAVTDRIIRETHEKHHHPNYPMHPTAKILSDRWSKSGAENHTQCLRCTRFTADAVEYKMGNLRSARVRESISFANTGVDFCDLFYIKEKRYRNQRRIKIYVCVFVCMSIKAIHLEIVSDLTSYGFLAALRRFIARRGMPEHVYSDNGTNFVGANNQLKEMYSSLNSQEHRIS